MTPTAAQRAAYHEAARSHSTSALVAWVITLAAALVAAAVQACARGHA